MQNTIITRFYTTNKYQKQLFFNKVLILFVCAILFFDPILFDQVILGNNRAFIKMFFAFNTVFYLEDILAYAFDLLSPVQYEEVEDSSEPLEQPYTIDGISIDKIISTLVKFNGRPYKVRNELNISTYKYMKIGDNLERVGILTRGDNNSRILAMDNVSVIGDMLSRTTNSAELQPGVVQLSDSEYQLTA